MTGVQTCALPISHSLPPDAQPERRQGVGLININKRLKYEYGTGLKIDSAPGRGTKVTVRIPAELA